MNNSRKAIMKKALCLFMTISVLFVFSSCKSKDTSTSIVGVWELAEGYSASGNAIPDSIEFYSDGTMKAEWSGTYSCDENRLNITYTAMDSYSYLYEIKKDSLFISLVDGSEELTDKYEYKRIVNSQEDKTVPTTEKSSLAESCDYLLSSGTNENGDHYELVAVESKSYSENDKIGVIKNNEWLIEPTEDCPLVRDGKIIMFDNYKNNLETQDKLCNAWSNNAYLFMNNCCFCAPKEDSSYHDYSYNTIWNVETNKSYSSTYEFKILVRQDEETLICNPVGQNEKYIMDLGGFGIVDTETMSLKQFDANNGMIFDYAYTGPVSDGMFFSAKKSADNSDNQIIEKGFYNINGELVINLTDYKIQNIGNIYVINYELLPYFENSQGKFEVRNDSGKHFELTIDKSGNVLSEQEIG